MKRELITALSLTATVLVVAYISTLGGGLGPLFSDTRPLAKVFLSTTLDPNKPMFTAMSPEGVTAIVWDYRGLDTLFETAVFYLAIIGAVAVYRDVSEKVVLKGGGVGLSKIVKLVTKLLIPMNIAIAISIALHGHLTPGGGFQAGAAMAVVPMILIVVFSRYFLLEVKISKGLALALRSIGLIGIAFTVFLPIIIALISGVNSYIMQNQVKFGAPFSFPAFFGDSLISGSLILYNLFELLAVTFGFSILFLLLSIEESLVKEQMGGEGSEH
ncbi:MAG: Na(+)/H(+) antiporter subunit B [Sulfolobales archaeon]|nr:Na(+)/H(+) antiporter subunit B [Sulfolobales archaeon]MCX8186433.1 Na(+)/H(+) antiporter subunit B [Sulfolobales archaeon]MDW7969763.1 Na(+)/H(+) antiporter subunit B [Sulfolobales archaeon]